VTESERELVRRGFEAYNRTGPSGFMDFVVREDAVHPDVRWYIQEDLPNGGEWVGFEGFEEMSRTWLEAWASFEIEPRDYIELNESAMLIPSTQRAVARGSGIEVSGEFFWLVLFRGDKIERMHLYTDRRLAEEAAAGATREASP
jgi:ketosteroid isomerase-like protein